MENLNWEYIITTLIAAYGAFNSMKARKETKLLAEQQLALQARSAQHQHFPNLNAAFQTNNSQIQVLLTNANSNTALSFAMRFILRIRADNASFEIEDYVYTGGHIGPHAIIHVNPEPINQLIRDAIPFLKRSSPNDHHNNFVIRIFLEAEPSVGGAEKVSLQKAARFKLDGDELIVLPDPHNELD
ncbi:hypothetical protein GNE00_15920 [Pseudomonas sp. JL972]|uniref:hypothetical protein n=1 Tax=Stutzerimonas degradans TaxID=2968968 RepID=UPI0012D887F8|nr:hypothetical protein [Stutzerimonas degradans]MTZ15237.1 hypothetical protein [Stutzerimonas degradans]